jgi:hypothetical protein
MPDVLPPCADFVPRLAQFAAQERAFFIFPRGLADIFDEFLAGRGVLLDFMPRGAGWICAERDFPRFLVAL